MSIGEGIAFAALAWMIVQFAYLLHHRSKVVTDSEVIKERLDRIAHHLDECLGPPMGP